MKFGTIICDPPWPYNQTSRHEKLSGYSDAEYSPLSIAELAALPVGAVADEPCVLLLWATWPFLPDALRLIDAWGFTFKTALPWVKATSMTPGAEPAFSPTYGVGYWLRGCSEPLLLALKGKGSVRTPWIGLLSPNAKHSRKPNTAYELAETFPGPHLELFARAERPGWLSLGNHPDLLLQGDIRTTLKSLGELPP